MPDGRSWVRLKEIGNTNIGLTYHPVDLIKTGIPVLRSNNIKDDKLCLSDLARVQTKILDNQFVSTGDILICARNGSKNLVGKCTIISNLPEKMAFGAFMAVFRSEFNPYILRYLQSIYFKDYLEESNSTQIYQLTQNMLKEAFLPLPPLSEQQLIVAEIEKIFTQIDLLEQNKTDLQTAIKQAKSKILDLAIHGKLVPQDVNDEPASVLLEKIRAEKEEKISKGKLKRDKNDSYIYKSTTDNCHYQKNADGSIVNIEDEIPFDVPDGWAWCRLGEIYYHTTGKALKKTNENGTLRKYITTSNLYWNRFDFTEVRSMYFTEEELEKCTIKKGDLVLCNGGDVGRAAIWTFEENICYQNHVSRLRPKHPELCNKFYLFLLMRYKELDLLNGKGVGITSLAASDLLSTIFPLPPLVEQQRIVAKIEELFSILNSLENNLI